jgi:GTPase SAR1 family protein
MMHSGIDVDGILNKRTLIIGDVGSGKTRLTAKILDELVSRGFGDSITVIDMAPSVGKIGLRLSAYTRAVENVRYFFSEKIRGPRLEGKDAKEVLEIAKSNREIVEKYFKFFLEKPTEILIVNDLTIYFHAGEIKKVFEIMSASKTFIAHAYYGSTLSEDKGSGLSAREKELVQTLSRKCDKVIIL